MVEILELATNDIHVSAGVAFFFFFDVIHFVFHVVKATAAETEVSIDDIHVYDV